MLREAAFNTSTGAGMIHGMMAGSGSSRAGSWVAKSLAPIALFGIAACASGGTLGSGVGDALLDRPPYYAGVSERTLAGEHVRIGHLPIAYQRGARQAPMFDPPAGGAMAPLLAEMNTFVEGLAVTTAIGADDLTERLRGPGVRPPDVQFGCELAMDAIDDECERPDGALGRGPQTMRLTVTRASTDWTAQMGRILEERALDRALLITVETAQYWTRQRGLRGAKEVVLGTGRVQSLPWLTSLETPVQVVQITGALVGRDGKAVRIGAEGVYVRRTRLTLSSIGAQELITDEDIQQLRTDRRDDLPGQPLAWQVALRELVHRLTGRTVAVADRPEPLA